MPRKKKILIHSNHCKMFTGFGKHKKNLLKYLHKPGKYELVELSNSKHKDEVLNMPWKAYGTLPSNQKTLVAISKTPTASVPLLMDTSLLMKSLKKKNPISI